MPMPFAAKIHVPDLSSDVFDFVAAKTMYGGKNVSVGDVIFIFDSENEGGAGLFARGVVVRADAVRKARIGRGTPRVNIIVKRTSVAKRRLGRSELKKFTDWNDDRPETELNFKFYRQATNKIVGISQDAASFLETFF